MSALNIVLTILQVLSGLALTVIVLMQSGKSAGLSGSISGGADTFLSKGKAKTLDAKARKVDQVVCPRFRSADSCSAFRLISFDKLTLPHMRECFSFIISIIINRRRSKSSGALNFYLSMYAASTPL